MCFVHGLHNIMHTVHNFTRILIIYVFQKEYKNDIRLVFYRGNVSGCR